MKNDKEVSKKKEKEFSTELMAFTFFFAAIIYILFLGFHFWDKHIDFKNDEQ